MSLCHKQSPADRNFCLSGDFFEPFFDLLQCMDAHGKEIYSFCKSLTGNQMEADDLYQDTFLTAMEKDDKIHMEGGCLFYRRM